MLFLCISI
jgi:hypothetical protein